MKNKILLFNLLLLLVACSSSVTKQHGTEKIHFLKNPFEIVNLSDSIQFRVLDKPNLASLDLAAYYQNPIKKQEDIEAPSNYKRTIGDISIADYSFSSLDSILSVAPDFLDSLKPIAYEPFFKRLPPESRDSLSLLVRNIESEKWQEPDVFKPFQRVSRLWGVSRNEKNEWWVEIEPAPWTKRKTFFGRLKRHASTSELDELKLYQEKELSSEDVLHWARTLTSYWYPTLNTDLELHTPGAPWNEYSPYFIIRGNPMGKVIRMAFDIKSLRLTPEALLQLEKNEASSALIERQVDTSSMFRLQTLNMIEACPLSDSVKVFQDKLKNLLTSLPPEQNAFEAGGMLWFRRNADYLLADDITSQDSLHNPLPRLLELKAYLDSLGIQLLVVPVPVKEEIYSERLISGTSESLCVHPIGRQFTKKMLESGLDIVDLYPILKAAKAGDQAPSFAFQRYDTHWANSGLLASLEAIAARITQYAWYEKSNPTPGFLEMRDTTIVREGDLVPHVPENQKAQFLPDTLAVHKVFKNNEPYSGKKNAPILLMGDSFTGVFESVDQRSGGPGSLIAFATGLDVQVLTSWGGGPGVRHRIKRLKSDLDSKRLVIYMMTARDFWRSPMEWDAF